MLGAMCRPTVQLHLTRTCNLECLHCYSSSGPAVREQLEVGRLVRFISEAAEQGYQVLALSGGEPLVYPDLLEVVRTAKDLGFLVSITTNGTLVDQRRWEPVRPFVDLVAVSVDGPPEMHDHLRNKSGAFDRMEQGLEVLKASGVPFGLIHTVTAKSFSHLAWLGEYAEGQGARLLQLHPLGLVGQGRDLDEIGLDGELMARRTTTSQSTLLITSSSGVPTLSSVSRLKPMSKLSH